MRLPYVSLLQLTAAALGQINHASNNDTIVSDFVIQSAATSKKQTKQIFTAIF